MSLLLQAAHCWHVQVVLDYLLWCMCLGPVQKGDDQASDPNSWLQFFGQDLCGRLASNIYIVFYFMVFFLSV